MYNISIIKEKSALLLKKIKDQGSKITQSSSPVLLNKAFILSVLSLLLAILLTPQIRFRHPGYKMGDIATRNVKTDRDLMAENTSATEQKRMEAINEIRSVYDYDDDVAAQILINLTSAFSLMKEISSGKIAASPGKNGDLLSPLKKNFERIVGLTVSAEEFQVLYQHKFSPSVAAKIAGFISSAYRGGMITNLTFLPQERDRGITVRDLRKQTEKELTNLSAVRHITDIELGMLKTADINADHERVSTNKVALTLAIKLIKPNLVYNKDATELRKQKATKDVHPVFLKVEKHEMLVREGEKITHAEMDKLDAYYRIKGEKKLSKFLIFTGVFFTIAFLAIILYHYANKMYKLGKLDILFIGVTALMQIIFVRVGIFVAGAVAEAFPTLPEDVFIYTIPFSAGAMLVSLLLNRKLAFLLSIFLSIIITFLFDGKISLFIFSFLGSVVAAYRIVDCRERAAFFKVGLLLGAVNVAAILSLGLIEENIFTFNTFIALLMGFLGGSASGLLVAGLLPLFESLFQYTTDIKLLELANLNQPIFQQMIMEAPGTYHHSIVMASMVETAAESIGANALLAKVSAYYHDIGKMKKPQYFIENQPSGGNKHDKLSPKMSSLVIISHVKDGCELAAKAKLSKEIINIIREHHGTSLVSYFFDKAKKDKTPSIRALPDTDFRYPGPKPQTREAGLVLLGDVMEASSRTLSNPTPARIKTLVRERIERALSDGQLDECELTLRDLNKVAESFTMILNGIFHHRIDYPVPVIHELNGAKKENNYAIIDRKPAEKNKDRSAPAATGSE